MSASEMLSGIYKERNTNRSGANRSGQMGKSVVLRNLMTAQEGLRPAPSCDTLNWWIIKILLKWEDELSETKFPLSFPSWRGTQ